MTRSIPLDVAIAEAEKPGFLSIEDLQRLASPQPANPAQVADASEDRRQFKNFHRLLCERFGYAHDEKDWFRDQVSLIEHIAAIGAGGQAVEEFVYNGEGYTPTGRTAALSKQEPVVGGAHTDDLAVDRFAIAMKAKLAKKRADGRGGWDNRDECTAEHLSYMLVQHTIKGDPLDVGNLAMMLHQRGDRIVIDDETRSIAAALGKESGWRQEHLDRFVEALCAEDIGNPLRASGPRLEALAKHVLDYVFRPLPAAPLPTNGGVGCVS